MLVHSRLPQLARLTEVRHRHAHDVLPALAAAVRLAPSRVLHEFGATFGGDAGAEPGEVEWGVCGDVGVLSGGRRRAQAMCEVRCW